MENMIKISWFLAYWFALTFGSGAMMLLISCFSRGLSIKKTREEISGKESDSFFVILVSLSFIAMVFSAILVFIIQNMD